MQCAPYNIYDAICFMSMTLKTYLSQIPMKINGGMSSFRFLFYLKSNLVSFKFTNNMTMNSLALWLGVMSGAFVRTFWGSTHGLHANTHAHTQISTH